MGLYISSNSPRELHYKSQYSTLHYVRHLSILASGVNDSFEVWKDSPERYNADGRYSKAMHDYKNLNWHSDADGSYTLDGAIGAFDGTERLDTGNSRELLAELEDLRSKFSGKDLATTNELATSEGLEALEVLYNQVKDTVENQDGVLVFC